MKNKKHKHYFKKCSTCGGTGEYEGYNGYDHPCSCHKSKYCKCGAVKHCDGSILLPKNNR